MNNDFVISPITDDDIQWACRQMGLPSDAFHGVDGKDPRASVIKLGTTADIAACPGSGKTTLLVAKLAILAKKWERSTQGVCVLSHTNVAREEIEQRLSDCLAGQLLLGYPHFVGTIHGFVNEFLAIPWLRSLGYPITAIDSEIAASRRWGKLSVGSKQFLETVRFSEYNVTAKQPDFSVGEVSVGGGKKLGTGTPTYKDMVNVCTESAKAGYFAHSEMFMWARDFLAKHPEITTALRRRFPVVFIDESQDNDNEQASLLYQLFGQNGTPAICQRFGDANQAIFNNADTEAPTAAEYLFPLTAIKKDLPNSHRFGQRIADIADPLGLVPYKLKGDGPKKPLASKAQSAEHTIFLFKDKAGAEKVLPCFGELLLATFNDTEIRGGTFKAVGQVHKKREDDVFPAYVGHYWPSYQPGFSKLEPRVSSFVEGASLAIERGRQTNHIGTCVQKLADCVLEVVRRSKTASDFPKRVNRHRLVSDLCESNPALLKDYHALVTAIAIEGMCTKQQWDSKMRSQVQAVTEHICGAKLPDSAKKFLDWPSTAAAANATPATDKKHPNVYRHINGTREVPIQVGSIHSVKGETHSATLVVETYYHDLNIDSIKEWLLGEKIGAKKNAKRINARLKLHYVALTRPAHLFCVAMMHSSFETAGTLDAAKVKKLEERGWKVRVI